MAADREHVEHRFRAMGSAAHVIVVDGPAGLARESERRIAELERRWSRFEPASEVSSLTRHAGSPVAVSPETCELVERSVAAWRITGGRFDPTVLGALVRAGYDRSFDELDPAASRAQPAASRTQPAASRTQPAASTIERCTLTTGAGDIEIRGRTVRLPAGTGFDAGGIGKGLAADIVADELRAAGAAGVCVNLGGDVRVDGVGPAGGAWTIAVEHPHCRGPIARIGIARGAVATSTTLRRRWYADGEERHHLIDPATGLPSRSDLAFVTVVGGHAWLAEVLAKAVLLNGSRRPFDLLAGTGAEALAVGRDGRVHQSGAIAGYLGAPLPAAIAQHDGPELARAS